jgi:hypothetical protein
MRVWSKVTWWSAFCSHLASLVEVVLTLSPLLPFSPYFSFPHLLDSPLTAPPSYWLDYHSTQWPSWWYQYYIPTHWNWKPEGRSGGSWQYDGEGYVWRDDRGVKASPDPARKRRRVSFGY